MTYGCMSGLQIFIIYHCGAGQVIFDSLHPSLPPDFIFDVHDRAFAPDLEELKVSALALSLIFIFIHCKLMMRYYVLR